MPVEEVEDHEGHKIRIALLPVGESMVELIEDQDRHGPYSTFIATRGEGIHHICFEVRDIDAALKELKQAGVPLHNEEPVGGHQNSRILFFNPPGRKDMLIELCEKAERSNEE
jgi:methylmalonyl-CoA/ethylmalonyl-CoA epimerase